MIRKKKNTFQRLLRLQWRPSLQASHVQTGMFFFYLRIVVSGITFYLATLKSVTAQNIEILSLAKEAKFPKS